MSPYSWRFDTRTAIAMPMRPKKGKKGSGKGGRLMSRLIACNDANGLWNLASDIAKFSHITANEESLASPV